jgi:hypothetical protein
MTEADADASGNGNARPASSLAISALLLMLDGVSSFGLVELEQVLAALLKGPAPTPAEMRVAELTALAQLLESGVAVSYPHHRIAPLQVSQADYDATRPPGAPSAETLIKRYGTANKDGWSWACRAARGLLPDGRKTKPGASWSTGVRGAKRPPHSDRDAVIRNIRDCAFALLRRPSSNVYIEWLDANRRRANAGPGGGRQSDGPGSASIAAVYQQFPRGWARALASADITDAELSRARGRRLASGAAGSGAGSGTSAADAAPLAPAERLAALGIDELPALGLDVCVRARLLRKGFGELPLSRAALIANALGGSLAWLAGTDDEPGVAADIGARFDADALRAAAARSGIKLEALRASARLDVSGWRSLMTGKREPCLAQVERWAAAVRSPVLMNA